MSGESGPAGRTGDPRRPYWLDPYGELMKLIALPEDPERLRAIRRKLVWAYAWAIPSPEAVEAVAALSPLIELGAGTGYWAWLLAQAGADVLAFDRNAGAPPRWREVLEGGPERILEHPERALLLCWPPLDESLALECLERYRGPRLAHIGELGPGARTGSVEFERRLRAEFALERELELPRWPGCEDRLTIWRRKA